MKKTTTPSSRSFRTSRLAVGASALAGGLALLMTPLGAGAQADVSANADGPASAVKVSFTPSNVTGECVPASEAIGRGTLQVYPFSDASVFRLRVVTTAPLCEDLTASAVVYKMPTNGEQWPQQLAETVAVSFKAPGETVIDFAKACDRVQYDLVTGTPPAVLNTGFDHQLLFPGNLETAFQHVGNGVGCEAPATTAASTTTTTAAPTTTAQVLGTTTIAPTTTIIPRVLQETATNGTSSGTGNSGLAVTGGTSGPIALVGGGLVLIGVSFLLASRRRNA